MTVIRAPAISSGRTALGERRERRVQYLDDFLESEWPHLPRGTPFSVLPAADFDAIYAATEDRPLLALERIVTVRMLGRKRRRHDFLRGVLAGVWLMGAAIVLMRILAP